MRYSDYLGFAGAELRHGSYIGAGNANPSRPYRAPYIPADGLAPSMDSISDPKFLINQSAAAVAGRFLVNGKGSFKN